VLWPRGLILGPPATPSANREVISDTAVLSMRTAAIRFSLCCGLLIKWLKRPASYVNRPSPVVASRED